MDYEVLKDEGDLIKLLLKYKIVRNNTNELKDKENQENLKAFESLIENESDIDNLRSELIYDYMPGHKEKENKNIRISDTIINIFNTDLSRLIMDHGVSQGMEYNKTIKNIRTKIDYYGYKESMVEVILNGLSENSEIISEALEELENKKIIAYNR